MSIDIIGSVGASNSMFLANVLAIIIVTVLCTQVTEWSIAPVYAMHYNKFLKQYIASW